jgi:putative copper export protein
MRWIAGALAAAVVSGLLLVEESGAGTSTRFGVVLAAAAGVAGLGLLVAGGSRLEPRLRLLVPLLVLPLLLAPTLAGHSFDSARSRVDPLIDLGHTVGAAFWLGSLAAIAVVIPTVRARPETAIAAAKRFSRLAVVTVVLIALTGLGNALVELSSVSQLWTTSYGQLLVLKTLLFALLLELGWVSRRRLAAGYGRLRGSVSAELAVLLVLVLVVGILTALPPGRADLNPIPTASRPVTIGLERLPPADAVVLAQRDGTRVAAISIRPSGAAVATFIGSATRQVDVGRVTIDGRPTRQCGVGCYEGTVAPGAIVTVRHGGATLRFDRGSSRGATALLTRMNRAYRRLTSVVYTQRIANGLGTKVRAHWIQTRDGFAYRTQNGARGVSIGDQRWDRSPGGSWTRSSATPSGGVLIAPWTGTGRLTNAHIVGESRRTYRVAFLSADKSYPVWFTVTVDRHSLRPLSIEMTAAAHFMRTLYRSWNQPITLRPPT